MTLMTLPTLMYQVLHADSVSDNQLKDFLNSLAANPYVIYYEGINEAFDGL